MSAWALVNATYKLSIATEHMHTCSCGHTHTLGGARYSSLGHVKGKQANGCIPTHGGVSGELGGQLSGEMSNQLLGEL